MSRGGNRKNAGAKKKEVSKNKYFSFRTTTETKDAIKLKYGKSFGKMFEEWVVSLLKQRTTYIFIQNYQEA